ncbi:MAG: Asp-tRNA(Asn)/Glu-tRNA(Gln) amidotransferase subunit GatA [Planctomycetes bacterium]|nr:Asp-tRNA(Asn)/Glu-tRNA(Gln) amidotransferase subunit GatA [Planctomycetota bacterium]NUQ33563.1 Asp-tRNA(Asn)/Glu-tRNA(Gln) amidotransferase subunit GatA [Planctomycetaceae bacterium]
MTAVQIAAGVRDGKFSALDVAKSFCKQIEKLEPKLHALLHYNHDAAIRDAKGSDQGTKGLRLAGVPIVVKDNICVDNQPLTCGSKILKGYRSTYSATAINRLIDEGAFIIGKSNLDEFAMGSSCEHSAYGPTHNPWDTARVPGGSSGGSAAAVAACYAPISLGSETGGSVRQPASLTGIVGIKPSYGRISRYGLVAFGSSLDQIGPFARTVEDAALALEIMSGPDDNDSTTLSAAPEAYVANLDKRDLKKFRVGYVPEHLGEGCDPAIRKSVESAIALLKSEGATIVELKLSDPGFSVATYYIVAPCEASSNLSRFDGIRYGPRKDGEDLLQLYMNTRGEGFGHEVKRRIMIGTFALSAGYQDAFYKKALKVRELTRREYAHAFEKCDVMVGPTSPNTAFKIGENVGDPLKMYLCDIYTIGANLAGIPAMSIPCGYDDAGLPIGLHIQAPMEGEMEMLQVAYGMEQRLKANRAPALAGV